MSTFEGVIGEANHVCESPYTTIDDSSLCEELAANFETKFKGSGDWDNRPTGCISNSGESKFWFNTNQNNVPKSDRKPVCILNQDNPSHCPSLHPPSIGPSVIESLNIVMTVSEGITDKGVHDTCQTISDSFEGELTHCILENNSTSHEVLMKLLVSNKQFIIDSIEKDDFFQTLNVTEEVNFLTIAVYTDTPSVAPVVPTMAPQTRAPSIGPSQLPSCSPSYTAPSHTPSFTKPSLAPHTSPSLIPSFASPSLSPSFTTPSLSPSASCPSPHPLTSPPSHKPTSLADLYSDEVPEDVLSSGAANSTGNILANTSTHLRFPITSPSRKPLSEIEPFTPFEVEQEDSGVVGTKMYMIILLLAILAGALGFMYQHFYPKKDVPQKTHLTTQTSTASLNDISEGEEEGEEEEETVKNEEKSKKIPIEESENVNEAASQKDKKAEDKKKKENQEKKGDKKGDKKSKKKEGKEDKKSKKKDGKEDKKLKKKESKEKGDKKENKTKLINKLTGLLSALTDEEGGESGKGRKSVHGNGRKSRRSVHGRKSIHGRKPMARRKSHAHGAHGRKSMARKSMAARKSMHGRKGGGKRRGLLNDPCSSDSSIELFE